MDKMAYIDEEDYKLWSRVFYSKVTACEEEGFDPVTLKVLQAISDELLRWELDHL